MTTKPQIALTAFRRCLAAVDRGENNPLAGSASPRKQTTPRMRERRIIHSWEAEPRDEIPQRLMVDNPTRNDRANHHARGEPRGVINSRINLRMARKFHFN
jgi:hypothetical protein